MKPFDFLFAALHELGKRSMKRKYALESFDLLFPGLILLVCVSFLISSLFFFIQGILVIDFGNIGMLISFISAIIVGFSYFYTDRYLKVYEKYKVYVQSMSTFSIFTLWFVCMMVSFCFMILGAFCYHRHF